MGGEGLRDLSRGTTAVAAVAEVGFDPAATVCVGAPAAGKLAPGSGVSANRTIQCFATVTAGPHQPTSVV